MPRSKKDILDTEAMLTRLTNLLLANRHPEAASTWLGYRADAESLRRISMTLHRWHELECNEDLQRGHIEYEPGGKRRGEAGRFVADDAKGTVYLVNHNGPKPRYTPIPDREAGARKRLAQIMSRYPSLTAYVQGDPRGCALYILKPGDVPEGATVDSCYSRGLAVYQ